MRGQTTLERVALSSLKMEMLNVLLLTFSIVGGSFANPPIKDDLKDLLKNYDKNWNGRTDEAVETRIGMYVHNLILDEEKGTLTMKVYLRQAWKDERFLKYFEKNDQEKLTLPGNLAADFWTPDTFVRNALSSQSLQTATTYETLFRVNKTGHVWYVHSLIMKLSCPQLLSQPGRTATIMCPIMFESYSYTMDSLYYSWLKSPVDIDKTVSLPAYILKDIILYDCSQNYTAGAFPCLEVRLAFKRDAQATDAAVYIVTFILVIASWYGPWMSHKEQGVARLGYALGCVLTTGVFGLATISWYGKSSPSSDAMVHWLLGCWICVSLPLLEVGLTYVLLVLVPIKLKVARDQSKESEEEKSPRVVAIIDTACAMVIFPAIFLLFNIIYWLINA